MRADRLLSILLLLQVQQRMTARELAKRLEVSERTIHRDMEALSTAGVPVTAERGTGGGWSLLEAYQTNLTGLTEVEIQALFLTGPARLLADLGLHQASEAALIKLLAALPSLSRRDAQDVRQRIHIDAAGWHNPEEAVPYLATLQDAIWQERKLRFIYRRSDDTTVERLVDPLGLVAKGSIWYLVGAVEGEIRTYRVSRVQGAGVTDLPCVRPRDFDLAAHWEQSSADFKANLPRYPATVRVTPAILSHMRYAGRYARIEHVGPADADGWIQVSILFEEEHSACEYVLSFGSQIEVVEPQALREKVIQAAESILALYAQSPHALVTSLNELEQA
ncbi:MAG: helix-turn-helix transcriptional regulator [Ktedonobacteraceae bacterium]